MLNSIKGVTQGSFDIFDIWKRKSFGWIDRIQEGCREKRKLYLLFLNVVLGEIRVS